MGDARTSLCTNNHSIGWSISDPVANEMHDTSTNDYYLRLAAWWMSIWVTGVGALAHDAMHMSLDASIV